MNVRLTAAILDLEENKVAFMERDVELPFVPHEGLMLHGVHPDDDGYSLMVHKVCWHHHDEQLYVDLGEVIVLPTDDHGFGEECDKWATAGWSCEEVSDLHPDEEDQECCGVPWANCGDCPDKVSDQGGNITITDCVVNIYNGGAADVHQSLELDEDDED